jgi:Nuclease-related domain
VAGSRVLKLHDDETVIVLPDRRIPGSRATIDHVAITRSGGVWAIDAKDYTGMVQRIDRGGWFRNDYRLYVGKRECTRLVAELAGQLEAITSAIGESVRQELGVQVRAALCFGDADWSLYAKPFAIDGVWIGRPEWLAEQLQAPGELAPEHLRTLARRVADAVPAA